MATSWHSSISGRRTALIGLALFLAVISAFGAPTKAPTQKPAANEVKGQGQLAGENGQFKTVYSLRNGFNFTILAAAYTLEPFHATEPLTPGTDEKLLVLDIALKNIKPEDNWFGADDLFTVVDEKGQLYPHREVGLSSKAGEITDITLRPGQGMGQPELKDPLRVAFVVPGRARIVKIMINQGRLTRKDEKVLRYYIAGATKAEAGEAGDPKNMIAPLPDAVKDPTDKSGAVALAVGKGTAGTFLTSGCFALRLDGVAYSTDPLVNGEAPEEGNKYAVVTVTAKNLTKKVLSMYEVAGGDFPLYELTDADGESAKPIAFRKAKKDEDAEYEFKAGAQYIFRIFFTLPADTVAKKLVLGTGASRTWAIELAAQQ